MKIKKHKIATPSLNSILLDELWHQMSAVVMRDIMDCELEFFGLGDNHTFFRITRSIEATIREVTDVNEFK
jgi:hypothetical protein